MTQRQALEYVTDYVVTRELVKTSFNASGLADIAVGATVGGALGTGMAADGAKQQPGWQFKSNLSPLHCEELLAFLQSEGMDRSAAENFLHERESIVADGKDPRSKRMARWIVGFTIPGVSAIVIAFMAGLPAAAIVGLALIGLGVLIGLHNPRKKAMDAIWGAARGPEESIAELLPRMRQAVE